MELEFETIEAERSWNQLFQEIRMQSLQHDYSTKEAKRAENRNLNRYRDVSPYDHSRVVLHRSDVDYINASVVPVEKAGREYILTQGPLIGTLAHFWLMIWEKNTKGIVMLNKLIEKNVVKCHQYWPDQDDRELALDSVELTVSFVAESAKENYICRTFRLHDGKSGESRDVLQFHYINWPDFGVPLSPDDFLDFLYDVRRSGCLEKDVGPAVIHCSAGIGRSGTFCLVDSILKMLENGSATEEDINLLDILLEMRRYRMSLIQTAEQLRFSYLSIVEALRRINKRSPFLSRKGEQDEDAPPPPPHRAGQNPYIKQQMDSSSDDDDEDSLNGDAKLAKNTSTDSAVSSEDDRQEDEDSDGAPPPLPPKDIPQDSLSEETSSGINGKQPSEGRQHSVSQRSYQDDSITEDLKSFEKEILAKENMIQQQQPLPTMEGTTTEERETELRQRKRQRDQKINEQIKAIKKGIQESEAAHQRRGLLETIGIGFVVFIGAGILVYRIMDYVRS